MSCLTASLKKESKLSFCSLSSPVQYIRENETFNWWMPGSDEVQEAEQRRNRRFEEEKRRREAQEEQEMEQEEELGMEM